MIWNFLMKITKWCFYWCFKLFKKELSDDTWCMLEQFIKFLLVGCSNTIVVLVIYYIVVWIGGRQYYLLGQTLGYIIGIINSFFWNSKFVFSDSKESQGKAFIKIFLCYGITYVIQICLLYVLVECISISEWLAPVICIIITTPINFVLNKLFAFKVNNP